MYSGVVALRSRGLTTSITVGTKVSQNWSMIFVPKDLSVVVRKGCAAAWGVH